LQASMRDSAIRLPLGSSRRRLHKTSNARKFFKSPTTSAAWRRSNTKRGTNAMMSFHSESGRGPELSDKLSVCAPAFDTRHMLRLSAGRPWQSVLNAASAARTRSPAVAEAIDDHGKLPKGVARQPGIKIMFLLVKPDGMSAREFHQYWLETHSPLVVSRSDDMAMRRYVQSHLVRSPMAVGAAEARGWPANPFQGVAEVWWDSEEAMAAAFSTPNGVDAGEALAEDEKKFLDDRSIVVMTREYLIFDKT
jgi:uncharacterized protein (TIGR02118 family)